MLKIDQASLNRGKKKFTYNVEIKSGSFTVVIGPNGGGKSTLILMLAGFLPNDHGAIYFNTQKISHLPPEQRPLSVLFQDHNLFPAMTVYQNTAIGITPNLRPDHAQQKLIEKALDMVGLTALRDHRPHRLSGGQRQRCALARALVRDQPVLLLDEPFRALDPEMRAQMLEIIKQIREDGDKTLIMVSHQPMDLRSITDQILYVNHGHIEKKIVPDGFAAQKKDPILRRYLTYFEFE